jgi:hypothetical protein
LALSAVTTFFTAFQLGQFVMIATAYGNRDHFWIRPE